MGPVARVAAQHRRPNSEGISRLQKSASHPRSRTWQETGGDSDSPVLLYLDQIGPALCSQCSTCRGVHQPVGCQIGPEHRSCVGGQFGRAVGGVWDQTGPVCPVRRPPWADGMSLASLDGAVGNGPLCKLCGALQVESCRPQRPDPTCPLSALQSPAAVPTWRTTFLQVEDGSLDSRKTSGYPQTAHPDLRKLKCPLGGTGWDEHSLAKTHGPTRSQLIRAMSPTPGAVGKRK